MTGPSGATSPEKEFNGSDLDLLIAMVNTNDAMLAAAQAVKLIEAMTRYPIRAAEDLHAGFERHGGKSGRVRVGRCQVSVEQAQRYLPPQAFPIEDREQLISCLLVAFAAERNETTTQLMRTQAEQLQQRGPRG
jgi:hypothetical protein